MSAWRGVGRMSRSALQRRLARDQAHAERQQQRAECRAAALVRRALAPAATIVAARAILDGLAGSSAA
jgi:hypothetical protein